MSVGWKGHHGVDFAIGNADAPTLTLSWEATGYNAVPTVSLTPNVADNAYAICVNAAFSLAVDGTDANGNALELYVTP